MSVLSDSVGGMFGLLSKVLFKQVLGQNAIMFCKFFEINRVWLNTTFPIFYRGLMNIQGFGETIIGLSVFLLQISNILCKN